MALDPDKLLADFDAEAKKRGFGREEIASGIPAYTRSAAGPLVLVSAGIHGDEPASPLAALAFLAQNPAPEINWLLTPLLNPSGIALGSRENGEGFDLNRDYHQPQSKEISAHLAWLARQATPELFVSFHEDYEASGFYFYEIQSAGRPTIQQTLLQNVREHMPIEPGPIIDGHECTGEGWFFREEAPTPEEFTELDGGFPEALALAQKGCPLSLTFETPTHQAPIEARIQAHLTALETAIDELKKF